MCDLKIEIPEVIQGAKNKEARRNFRNAFIRDHLSKMNRPQILEVNKHITKSANGVGVKTLVKKFGHENKCCSCGSTENLTKDHWIPSSKGGWNTVNNLVIMCSKCNTLKGNMLIDVNKNIKPMAKKTIKANNLPITSEESGILLIELNAPNRYSVVETALELRRRLDFYKNKIQSLSNRVEVLESKNKFAGNLLNGVVEIISKETKAIDIKNQTTDLLAKHKNNNG